MNTFYRCRLCGESFNRIEMVTFEPDGTRSPPLADPVCPHCGEVYRRPPPVLREVPSLGAASAGSETGVMGNGSRNWRGSPGFMRTNGNHAAPFRTAARR